MAFAWSISHDLYMSCDMLCAIPVRLYKASGALRQMLGHLAAVPSRYLRLWVLNFAAALLQATMDIVAFANMPPAVNPQAANPRAATGQPRGAPPGAVQGGGDWGDLSEQALRGQGLAMAVLGRLIEAMQAEARGAAADEQQQQQELPGHVIRADVAMAPGLVDEGTRMGPAGEARGAPGRGDPERKEGGGGWEAVAAGVQAAALEEFADDARWRLDLLAKMAPSVQQRRPGRTGAWGCFRVPTSGLTTKSMTTESNRTCVTAFQC